MPTTEIDKKAHRALRNRALWRYFKRGAPLFGLGALFLLVTNYLTLRIPKEIGAAVDHLRQAHQAQDIDAGVLTWSAATIALLAAGAALSRVFSRVFPFNAARNIEYELRNDLYEHLLRMSPGWFQRQATGDLVSRVTNDVTQVRLLYGIGVLHIVNTVVAYAMVLVLMFQVSPRLTLYSLLPYPLLLATMRLFTQAVYKRTHVAQEALSDISAHAQENLSGAAVIRAFGVEQQQIAHFTTLSHRYQERNLSLARARGGMIPYMGMVSGVGMLLVLGFGGYAVIDQSLTLGEYVEFSGYIVTLTWPTIAMGWVLSVWNRGTAAFDRITEIQASQPEVTSPPGALQLERGSRDIVFEGVSLAYPDGTQALEDIHLRIKAGSRVALVGRTGSGKSTLVKLIARLRDPSQGRLLLGDTDLRQIDLPSLRSWLGFVPQDPFLFSLTARENIRFGLQQEQAQTRLSLEDALRIAHLEDDVEALHDGLDTVIGERGVTLSGGQKQRMTLARAVLLDPQVLILDDALASVDTATERQILEELDQLMQGRTSIMVTHRFNALELFDEILVLDEGRLVERGTQRELLQRGGVYAQMHRRQMSEEEA